MKHKATKRILSLLLAMVMLVGLLPTAAIPVFAVEESDIYAEDPNYEHGYFLGGRGYWEGGTWVREVYDWDDMDQVFEKLDSASMVNYGYVTVKLMENLELTRADSDLYDGYFKRYIIPAGLNNVIIDFNGHTLSGTNVGSNSKNFIKTEVREGNHVTFTDSVGGGGINFDASYSNTDLDISALYIYTFGKRGEGYNTEDPDSYPAKVTFNGGTYKLIGEFTYIGNDSRLSAPSSYIGTVIADYVDVEINGGTFIAENTSDKEGPGEHSAFGTIIRNDEVNGFPEDKNPEYGTVIPFVEKGHTVINGGSFISDGYAFHHFDNCQTYLDNGIYDYYYWHNAYYVYCVGLNSHFHMNCPTINGGYFEGQLGFTGLTLTDSEGNEELSERPAFEIIPKTAYFVGVDRDGNKSYDITNWTWDDLHDMQKCIVVSSELFEFKVTHEGTSNLTNLTRTVKQSDTFEMSWTIPSYLEGEVVCQPMITVTRPNSGIEPQTYAKSKITLDYSEYPNDVNISFGLYIFVEGEDALLQQAAFLRKDFRVDVKRVYTVTDNCLHCYVANDGRVWNEIVEGGSCSFKIYPKDYYELTDPDKLEVYVNGVLVTPDEDGVYTVENVTEDLDVYCDGSAFTSYSNLTVTANGKTVTEKIFNGGTYTFKTLAEFGGTVPENSTFTGWKIGGKTYQPGETYTVPGGTEIAVNAVFTGLHNITVENGKAYADEAHTIPISAAAEDQVIYIVADPAPEGKVFSYWKETEITSPGGDGWFGSYDSAQTTYTVYYSDVVLAPVYETPIDHIVINGMTKPSAGVAIDNSDYTYKWGCSVPADAGYSLGICYWYDITDGEPEFAMSSGDVFQIGHTYRYKAKINLYGDTILAAKENISVALTGLDADSYTWTISEYSQIYENMVIYFEFTCEREEPDTSIERPEGSGTVGDPFKISTVGELYWFTGFTNNYVAVGEDFAVERNKAHAILMNDIIVNPELLTDSYGLNASSSLLADWSPICASKGSPYCGTFDGQGYSISGLYYNTNGYQYEAYGFIARLGENGAVKNLTLKDTYFFRVYTGNVTPYAAGIVAFAPEASNRIENCHFDGVVGTKSDNFGGIAGGIVATNAGTIKDCTVRGRVIGRDSYSGDNGKAGGIAGQAYVTAMISDCTNYAEVLCMDSGPGVGYAGGIAGYLAGTVKDCSNWGFIHMYNHNNYTYAGGIVGAASGTAEQRAVISRCFNEASFTGSGIVDYIYNGYVTVKNCYNTGSVTTGIVGIAKGAGISITYCHNVGITTKPIIDSIINADDIEMKNCYYVETSHYDTDRVEMTDAMLSEEFADGTVLALLDNGHWTQGEDDEYPVLGDAPGVTISGMVTSFGKESEKTTVQLFLSGSETPAFSITLTGTHAMYSFTGVEAGTYTMKVSKANHVTREYTVVVGNSPIPLDAKIHLKGDINGDGRINVSDVGLANAHAKKVSTLEGYQFDCANVNGDTRITISDVGLLNAHAKKTSLLW